MAISSEYRHQLLSILCANGVNLIFSGHTHMTSFPEPYDCGTHKLKQVILTSVNAQLDWQSESKYYPKGKPQFALVKVNEENLEHELNMIEL